MQIEAGDKKEEEAKLFLESHEGHQKSLKRKRKANETFKNYTMLDTLVKKKFKKFKLKGQLSQILLDINLLKGKHFSPSCFWFIIGSQYFPFKDLCSTEVSILLKDLNDQFAQLPENKIQIRFKQNMQLSQPKMQVIDEQFENVKKYANEIIEKSQDILSGAKFIFYIEQNQQIENSKNEKEFEFLHTEQKFEFAYKPNYTNEDSEFVLGMRKSLMDKFEDCGQDLEKSTKLDYLKNLPLEQIIELEKMELEKIQAQNRQKFQTTIQNLVNEQQKIGLNFDIPEDQFQDSNILMNTIKLTKPEQNYLEFLYEKQGNNKKQSDKPQAQLRSKSQKAQPVMYAKARFTDVDVPCKICNNPDYQDDDLIVFCSCCNICVHQSCYGLQKIPEGDFICELCQNFGKSGQFLRCPLCNQRGGAMKPTIYSHEKEWKECKNLNKEYYNFFNSQQHIIITEESSKQLNEFNKKFIDFTPEVIMEHAGQKEKLYYDFQQIESYQYYFLLLDEEIQKEPHPTNVWCHMTCALWIPEIFFEDEKSYSQINNFSLIKAERFEISCDICKKKNIGACARCAHQKCLSFFHPECARRANLFIDKQNWQIYCEKHTPLMLQIKLEQNNTKYQEEIIKFCQKFQESKDMKEKCKYKQISNYLKRSETKKKGKQSNYKIRLEKLLKKQMGQDYEDFRKCLQSFFEQRQNKIDSLEQNKHKRSKKKLCWSIKKSDPVWEEFQYKNFTIVQKFKFYKIMIKKLKEEKINRVNTSKEREIKYKGSLRQQFLPDYKQKFSNGFTNLIEKNKQTKIKKGAQNYLDYLPTKQTKIDYSQLQPMNNGLVAIRTADGTIAYKQVEWVIKNSNHGQFSFLIPGIFVIQFLLIYSIDLRCIEEQNDLRYCYCKQLYIEGDKMMVLLECEKCLNWFHFDCIGFIGTDQDASNLTFFCEPCEKKLKKIERKKRQKLFGKFFDNHFKIKSLAIRRAEAKLLMHAKIESIPVIKEVAECEKNEEIIKEEHLEKIEISQTNPNESIEQSNVIEEEKEKVCEKLEQCQKLVEVTTQTDDLQSQSENSKKRQITLDEMLEKHSSKKDQ